MQPIFDTSSCKSIGVVAAFAAGLIINPLAARSAGATDTIAVVQQNALIQKYCAVCHTDAARNGGLSLEHFDLAQAAPSLTAMMIAKLTSGLALGTVQSAASDPAAAALVARKMRTGAIGAAGIPMPDDATLSALIGALASQATGAFEWQVSRTQDPTTKAPMVSASILRDAAAPDIRVETETYRLTLACNVSTHEGEMQLAWAPVPRAGTLSVAPDGEAAVTYTVEGIEKMGNGSQGSAGPAAVRLSGSRDASTPAMPLPARTLSVGNLFPNQAVEFPFDTLPRDVRQLLASCFAEHKVRP